MIKKSLLLLVIFTAASLAQNANLLESKFLLARNYESAGQFEKAEKIYYEIFTSQPWNDKYFNALNNIYLKQKKYDASVKLLQSRIKKSPDNIELYGLLGTTYYTAGEYDKAFETWDKALNITPQNPINYRIIANYAIQNRAFDKAIEILKRGERRFNNSPMFLYDLAGLYAATMNYTDATKEYCRILKLSPAQLSYVKSRISVYIQNKGVPETAIKIIQQYYDETNLPEFLNLLASIYFQTKNFDKAFETVKKLDGLTNSNGSKIFAFAQKTLAEHQYSTAAKAFDYLINNFNDASFLPSAELGFAKSKENILTQKIDSSIQIEYESPENVDSNAFKNIITAYLNAAQKYNVPTVKSEALFRVGLIYAKYLNNKKEALKYFEKIIEVFPYSSFANKAKIEAAKIRLCNGKETSVVKTLKEFAGRKNLPQSIKSEALFLSGKLNYWKGNFTRALKILNEIASKPSDDNANDALELSLIISVLKSDSLTLAEFSRADRFFFCNKYDSAKALLLNIYGKTKNFVMKDLTGLKLAEISIAGSDIPTATAFLDSISRKEKLSLFADKALYLEAEINEHKVKNYKAAIRLYEKLLEKFPNSLYFDKSRQKINSLTKKLNNL